MFRSKHSYETIKLEKSFYKNLIIEFLSTDIGWHLQEYDFEITLFSRQVNN